MNPQLLSSLFASLMSFPFSSEIQFKTCYWVEIEQFQSHDMDKICLEFATFKEFATAVLQTEAKRCLSSCAWSLSLNPELKLKVCAMAWTRRLNRCLGSIAKNGADFFHCLLVWARKYRALVSYWNRHKMPTILIQS